MSDFERSDETVMLAIFKGCIETGLLPQPGSKCHIMISDLVERGSKPPIPEQPFKPGCV